MKRFLIRVDDVYYLTTGKLLSYDFAAAKGDKAKEHGVQKVEAEFNRIHDLPRTWYHAVEIADASFSAINTGG